MTRLGYLIPAGLVLAAIAALIGWDLIQNIRQTPPRRHR